MSSQDPIPPYSEWLKTRKPPSTDIPPFEQFKASRTTRPRNQAQAEADAARVGSELDKARQAYMSASGKTLNPPVDPSSAGGYRPLTASEQAAQKRGEPIIISEAGPVAPAQPSSPRAATPAPVSLDPVIQGRLEQIEREKRQRETQQKVEQARQVMQRRQGLVLPAGQRNEGPASKATFGLGQTYREWNPRAAEAHEKPGGMVMGEFRRREERDARIAREIRPQVVKDYFGMGAGVRQEFPPELQEQQIASDPQLRNYIESETQRRAALMEERENQVSRVERGIAPPLGLADKIQELKDKPEQLVPFLSSIPEIDNLRKVGVAAEKLERNETLTKDEELRIREFLAAGKQDSTLLYQVADVISALPAFVGEFAATGGIYSAGKKVALKGLERLVTKEGLTVIEKKLAGRIATKVATGLVGAAAQSLPAGATRIPAGVLYRQQSGEEFGKALRDTLTDQFIEIASERAGGLLEHIPLPKKIAAIRDAVTARWVSKVPGRTAEQLQKIVEKTGWNGPLGEIFEERVGDVAKYATGLQASPVPSLQQLAVEGLAFSLPGVVEAGANKVLQGRAPIPDSERNIYYEVKTDDGQVVASGVHVNDLVAYMRQVPDGGALRIKPLRTTGTQVEYRWIKPSESQLSEGQTKTPAPKALIDYAINSPLTSSADKAKLEKLVKSGETSTEDVQAILSGESSTTSVVESKEVKPVSRPKEAVSSSASEVANKISTIPTAPEEVAKTQDIIPENIQPDTETARQRYIDSSTRLFQIDTRLMDAQREGLTESEVKDLRQQREGPFREALEAQRQLREHGFEITPVGELKPRKEPAEAPPAELKTQPSATESQITTKKEVTDELAEPSVTAQAVKQPDSLKAPGQETVPDRSVVADISPRTEEPKTGNTKLEATPAQPVSPKEATKEPLQLNKKLTDWGTRLKTIAQSKNLNDLQALSDEMAGDKADPRVARLRASIQEKLASARQPEIPEQKAAYNISKEVPEAQKLSQKATKLRTEAETPEGKTVRSAPTHRIGAPKADASRNSLEQQVRAHGGIKDDADQAYKGELKWLSESAKRGAVNQTGGTSVEQMATKLAQDGYGKGVWWEGSANNVDPQKFLQAVMDDARGSTKHYSSERDEIEDDPDVKAWDSLVEDDAGKELIERVQSGHARAADIVQFVREASAHGLSDNAIDAFVASLQRTVQEELSAGTQEGEGYTLDEDGTLLDPDGSPLFAREFQLGLPSEGLTQQAAQPKADDQRERLRLEQQERDEAADPKRAKALRKLEEIHRRGMSVDEYSRQGSMFEAAPSKEEIKLLRELERGQPKPESGQSRMFARGLGGIFGGESPKFEVESNRVSLNNRAALDLVNKAYETLYGEKGHFTGVFEKAPVSLAKEIRALKDGAELADAITKAAKEGDGKVVIFSTERTRKHELFHESSHQANRYLNDRHAHMATLQSGMDWMVMKAQLLRMGYPDNPSTLVEEAAAHIADGSYEKLGLTRDEAVEWMYKWFTSFSAKNPSVNPRQFQEMSDEAVKARDEVYAAARPEREQVVNEALPSLQAGREEGDREDIAAARQGKTKRAYPLADRGEWYSNADYVARGGKITEMSPDEFLAQARPLEMDEVARDNIDDLKRHIEKGRTLDPAALYADGKTDGRHRAIAAKELGIESIPVIDFRDRASLARSPDILMARSDDPWADLESLADEFERIANEPELAAGEKPRSLPKTLEAAGLEAGPERGYLPESVVDDGVERAKQVIADKGIDGAMEFVRTGDGIEWASTGYEVSGRLRTQEATLRAEGKTAEADEVQTKRLKFLDDFAMGAVERGRSIVGIKAIAEYAPDRMAYMLNKASLKKRKRGISPEEESRITKLGEELGALEDRNKALEKALDAAKAQAKRRAPAQGKAKKSDYQSRLDEQAQTVLQTLKPKVGKFDLTGLRRTTEKGALTIGIPPLPGDAELIAQYAAAKLGTLNTVADLNAHLLSEFGQEIDPYLSKIRQRAYAIRQEARLAEIEAENTEPKRRKTILSEIQKEIGDSLRTIREAQKAQDLAAKAQRAAEAKSERAEARLEAQQAREQEHEARKQEIKDARAELKRLRQEMKEASKAETKGYRETIKAQKEAARKAELWDTPIRNEAIAASERLQAATDVNDPQVMADLVSVAAAKFLPEKEGGTPRTGGIEPSKVYRDLKDEFPALVTKKNQAEIYKRGYQRIQDATAAAREAARMRSASAEAKRLWDELGVDVDAQAVLIQQAEVRRQTDELRRKAVAEFNRVNKTMLEKVWMEVQSIPRALQSSIDAPLGRQGVYFLLTHPIQATKAAVPATLQGYGSIHVVDYARHETDLKKHPDYDLAVKSGLDLSVTSSGGDPALVAEEQFQSPLASRIFPHVRLSEQGYVMGMNAERLAMFSRLADTGRGDGYTPETHPEFFEAVARFVNDGTGRGNLPDAIKRASALTNFFFFSTRLNLSRIQLLNDLFNPVKYVPEQYNAMRAVPGFGSYDPAMRKVMAKELLRLAAALGTVYLIASAMGIKIELDPDDPDALLLRVRNTRYDITGGEVGTIRFLYRFLRSIYKTANGEDLAPFEQPLAIAGKFTRYKLAPLPGGVIDALTGKDAVGQPANLRKFESPKQVIQQNVLIKRLLPMMTGNLVDAVSEEGWIGIPMTLPALAGFGMSSYPDRGIRAIKNQTVVDTLEELKITSQSLLGQKTKNDELDKAIEGRIMAKVETLDIPQGATDIGKEKIIRERLAQIRLLAKAETALADPERYKHYLADREAGESLSFLTDDEKKTLTEEDLKAYRQSYAENYLKTLQRVASTDNYQKADDDKKEKILARVGQAAHTLAKAGMVKTKRKGQNERILQRH